MKVIIHEKSNVFLKKTKSGWVVKSPIMKTSPVSFDHRYKAKKYLDNLVSVKELLSGKVKSKSAIKKYKSKVGGLI